MSDLYTETLAELETPLPPPLAPYEYDYAPDAPPVLTLADLDAQIAQTQAVVDQLRGELAASEPYQALTRMSGGLDALKAMRAMLVTP